MTKIAVIRIRGFVNVKREIAETMEQLGLNKKHTCVVLESSPSVDGMIHKVKDYVTFGPISEETAKLLDEKRGKTAVKKETRTVYFLAPPVKGFERKGIKKTFKQGGALGDREAAINDLIARMI